MMIISDLGFLLLLLFVNCVCVCIHVCVCVCLLSVYRREHQIPGVVFIGSYAPPSVDAVK